LLPARTIWRDDPGQFPCPINPLREALVKKQISAVIAAAAALAVLAACSATPTASNAAEPGEWHADNTTPADTTNGRVPNLFGSGN
jgi:hypothetical protein